MLLWAALVQTAAAMHVHLAMCMDNRQDKQVWASFALTIAPASLLSVGATGVLI